MKKILKWLCLAIFTLLLISVAAIGALYLSADMKAPQIPENRFAGEVKLHSNYRKFGQSMLRKSESGLWEMRLEGDPVDRGVAFGKLTEDLLYYQEKVFVDQIQEIVPSDGYLKFLHFFITLFNRNLGENIPDEYRQEIYALSQSCTHEYDFIGSPYERQLNYHGAHDIGHAMQDYMLVGCSSFGAWDSRSADSTLIIGRNFDFYVGDAFAQNKLVSFYVPDQGYKFASVGWAGMVGVLSGMNETGLTVTLNAAKSTVPTSAAMPISILAREILQYASTIDEAYKIAEKRKTFVSESLLIGSAKDGRAAIIEKAVDKIALYTPDSNWVICTNHYQSELYRDDERNRENIRTSDSPYRYTRAKELLERNYPLDPGKSATILRDCRGKGDKNIGLGNEKALNQFIAHHSVIFKPEQRIMWVSTTPWQIGRYVAYDLNKIFAGADFSKEIYSEELNIDADTLLCGEPYRKLLEYRESVGKIKKQLKNEEKIDNRDIDKMIKANPQMYYAYVLAGDCYFKSGDLLRARNYWKKALTMEIPKTEERLSIEKKIQSNRP